MRFIKNNKVAFFSLILALTGISLMFVAMEFDSPHGIVIVASVGWFLMVSGIAAAILSIIIRKRYETIRSDDSQFALRDSYYSDHQVPIKKIHILSRKNKWIFVGIILSFPILYGIVSAIMLGNYLSFAAVGIIVVIILSILSFRRRYKRKPILAGWAFAHGMSFTDHDERIAERYPFFKCLKDGENRYGYNVMEGTINNRKVCAFDYHYEVQKLHFDFSAIILDTGLRLKPLIIREETFPPLMEDLSGFSNIKFESTEFNKQFNVKSLDRKWAYDVLNQSTMEFLLGSPHFILEFHDRYIIAYRRITFSVAEFDAAIELITGILDRLTTSLVQEIELAK